MNKKLELNFTKKPEMVFQFDQFLNVEQAVDKFLNKKENLERLIAPLIPTNLEETIQKLIPEVEDWKTPIKGIDYNDGKDGETPDEETLLELIKTQIPEPIPWNDGKTPEKWVDYFTKKELEDIKKGLKEAIMSEMTNHITKEEVNIRLEEIKKQVNSLPQSGGAQFLRQLMDVNVWVPTAQQYGLTYNPSRSEFSLTAITGGGGAVDSVNWETGVVVLDQDDIGDGATYKQYSATEKTKLAGIETGADVTDATNVWAAGAFMKSVDDTDDITVGSTNKFATAAEKTKLGHITVTQAVDLDTMESDIAALANGMVYKWNWDASAGTFPWAWVAQTGWFYTVSVGWTVDSVVFVADDRLVATTDNASATVYAGNWTKLDATDAVTSIFGRTGNVVATSGDYTTAIVADSADKRYVTDAQLTVIGNTSGTNSGNQTITNSSDATSHTVTLSASGGSVQLIEGTNITLTTGGTASAGTVTIAATGSSGATTALDNLASVAINTSLVSDTDNTDDLGTTLKKWANLFVTTIGATATRVTKGWFTDLEVTNAITGSITGNAATVTTNANLTGDVTSTGNATTIANSAVTLAKMANLAQDQFIGRTTASTGVPETATITAAARTVLDDTTVAAMVDTLWGATSTGTGGLVRATSPTLVTPLLGTPTSGVLTNCTGLTEAWQTLADNTTNDVSTTKHGYAPKWDGSTTKFLNANGAYSTPAASTITSAVRAYLTTSAQTVSTGYASRATVQFNAESFDVDGEFNTGTYTFTPAATGKYQLNIHIGWNNWASSDCELYLVIGGVENLVKTFPNAGSGAWTMDYSDLVTLTATSSTVLVKVAQYTGGNRNINTGEYVTNFSIKRVS